MGARHSDIINSSNVLQPLINLLTEKFEITKPGARKDAVEDLIYLLQSHNEDRSIAMKGYEVLVQLAASNQDIYIQKTAQDALERYPSPEKWFASLKRIKQQNKQHWQPHPLEPDTNLVPAGLFLMGSEEDTGVEIPKLYGLEGIPLEPQQYISEAVAKQFIERLSDTVISYTDERPLHSVYLDSFEIGIAPVTNSQYAVFLEDSGYQNPLHWINGRMPAGSENFPIVYVSWYDAVTYCEWLTKRWRLIQRIGDNAEVRLPTEAQWEKAARGNDGRAFPWGNEFNATLCNHRAAWFGETTPVGYFHEIADSPFGCKDMAGNVWDWTLSIWGMSARHPQYKYPYQASDGRESLKTSDKFRRVIRGGAFYYSFDCLRCAVRNRSYPFTKHESGSFRIAVVKENIKPINTSWLSRKV